MAPPRLRSLSRKSKESKTNLSFTGPFPVELNHHNCRFSEEEMEGEVVEKTNLRKNRSPVLHKPHNLSKHLPLAPNLAQVLISRALDQLRGDCPYCPVSHHRNVHQDSPCTDGLNNLVPERYLPLKMPGADRGCDLTPCKDNTCRSRCVSRSGCEQIRPNRQEADQEATRSKFRGWKVDRIG